MQTHQAPKIFTDRTEAGRLLAERLRNRVGSEVVVLGLTRGGIPVAFEVARLLAAPLDVVVVARLGIPSQPEAGMGAVAEGGIRIIISQLVEESMVSPHEVKVVVRHEQARVAERVNRLRGDRAPLLLGGRTAVIVDDGLVTGSSAQAACQAVRYRGAAQVIVAVPVASEAGLRAASAVADDVIALQTYPDPLAIGQWYLEFDQTDDDDIAALLRAAESEIGSEQIMVESDVSHLDAHDIVIPVDTATLYGRLTVPVGARELVVLAHDGSQERFSARSRYLSRVLTEAGFATLLVDLLTRDEDFRGNRFLAINLLADRLRQVSQRVGRSFDLVDYAAAGIGAAAALEAAAQEENDIHAVVCFGGRPDLAARLGAIRAPVLFVVGEEDSAVVRLTKQTLERLTCRHRMVIIPEAGHRFREPGALREAAALLQEWLMVHGDQTHSPATSR